MNREPFISIIIPVYNCFKYMDKCIDSLEKQTCKDFKVIFIEDCSKDDTYIKLKEKLKTVTFDYLLLKNEKNCGPGKTRNRGLIEAQSKYLTFIDSDDYVTYDFIDIIKQTIVDSKCDILLFDYYSVRKDKLKKAKAINVNKTNISNEEYLALTCGMCWGKVYKKDVVNSISFPEITRGEDLAFSKVALSKGEKIKYIEKPLYYYVQNDTSIMHSASTINIDNNKEAFKYIEKNITKIECVEMIFIREYMYQIVELMIKLKYSKEDITSFINECNQMYPNWNKNKYIAFQPKHVKIILSFINKKWLLPIRLLFKIKEIRNVFRFL